MEPLILALDSGTTSTRALAFDLSGRIADVAQYPLTQSFPEPGRVEHDAAEIWALTLKAALEVMGRVGERVQAIGLTNQRETICFWSRRSGEPLAPAIVWQDRRTADLCAQLKQAGHEAMVQATTGLLLDPYFSATKIRWTLDNRPEVRAAAESGDLAIGTVESWLLYKLTGAHLTDASNASRTLLMDLETQSWSPEMLDLFGVPPKALPAIAPTASLIAETHRLGRPLFVSGLAGDQQAATIGQGCDKPGLAKCTYGTGIFLLANAGSRPPLSRNRLLSTFLSSSPRAYALEGSIFVGGDAVKWLRDGLGILDAASETEALARSVPDSGGVVFVPAFAGLGAPHWQPLARGTLTGLTGGTTRAHIVRATLEAMGQQTADLIDTFRADGVLPSALRVDGGMVANEWLCQDIADATGLPVERPRSIETTGLGAAMLAGVGTGLFADLAEAAAAMVHADRRFEPRADEPARAARRAAWQRAVAQTLAGVAATPTA
ncbi:glycerol kinase GlpK [Sandaracinobacter sp. RS1-74]|uniref:FGGY family carbohydrate kinase n=1 Tax=Sandaracinobacteroides sayramensis TaxID=2913411 RepID=UPI001EDB8D3D|nr:glycerol kinase GlpK [Sandaracinobacteroides sayramensis]MCG2842417.1 glycerol kinase GlpK [Sandaracinobacteroides sayramensis]